MIPLSRSVLAEFLGTFLFVFIAIGAVLTDHFTHGALGWTGIALANGLSLAAILSAAPFSDAQCNPALTLGLWVARKLDGAALGVRAAAQLAGALAAGLLLRWLFPQAVWMPAHLGAPNLMVGISPAAGLVIEFVLTFGLMLALLGTAGDPKAPRPAGWGIGLAYAAAMLLAGPLTGGAFNPAKAFGPAAAIGFFSAHWIYWIGPLAGAAVAAWLYPRTLSVTL